MARDPNRARNHGAMLDISDRAMKRPRLLAEHDFQRLHALFTAMHDHVSAGRPVQYGNFLVDMMRNYNTASVDIKVCACVSGLSDPNNRFSQAAVRAILLTPGPSVGAVDQPKKRQRSTVPRHHDRCTRV
jgi:hypothetical protein